MVSADAVLLYLHNISKICKCYIQTGKTIALTESLIFDYTLCLQEKKINDIHAGES